MFVERFKWKLSLNTRWSSWYSVSFRILAASMILLLIQWIEHDIILTTIAFSDAMDMEETLPSSTLCSGLSFCHCEVARTRIRDS